MRIVTNPAERQFHGYAGPAPIYVSPNRDLLVDRFDDDEPGHVRVCASVASSVAVRLSVADAQQMATAILARFRKPAGVTPVELSLMLHRHRPVEIGRCRVCGHDLTVPHGSGEVAATYVCASDEATVIGKPGGIWSPEADAAADHRRRSEVRIRYHGDGGLVAVLAQLRQLRTLLGEDMTVPVGTRHFPYGHGRDRCLIMLVHRGGDVWEREHDPEFTHNPAHKTLRPEEITDDGA